jgi:hypothetical protein
MKCTLISVAVTLALACFVPLNAMAQVSQDTGLIRLDSIRALGPVRLEGTIEYLSAALGTLRRIGSFQGTERYAPAMDTLWVGGVRIDKARLFFFRRRLHSAELTVRGQANAEVLLWWLQTQFGPGEQLNSAAWYRWIGQLVVLNYEQNILTRDAIVRIESISMQRAIERGFAIEMNER